MDKKGFKILRYLLGIVLLITFIFSINKVFKEEKKLNDEEKVIKEIEKVSEDLAKKKLSVSEEINALRKKFNNSDIIGILIIDDLNINVAVVQGKDNTYYLKKSLYKNYHSAGSIFLDYRNDLKKDYQLNIYGHSSTKNRFLFDRILKYLDKDFFKKARKIKFKHHNQVDEYELHDLIITKDNDEHTKLKFSNLNNYNQHLKNLKNISKYKNEYEKNDKILILQTCMKGKDSDKKLAVIFKKINK